jgi:hypothetical protein
MSFLLALLLAAAQSPAALHLTLDEAPADWRLYPRGADGVGTVVVSGRIAAAGWEEIALEIAGEDGWQALASQPLSRAATGTLAPFALSVPVRAACVEHDVLLVLRTGARSLVAGSWEGIVAGDVFLCQGQSNMVAADYYTENLGNQSQRRFIRSFGSASTLASEVLADQSWHKADGEESNAAGTIGAWALRMGQILLDRTDVPLAILNGSVGGTWIALHQRNDTDPDDLTTIYGRLLWRAQRAGIASAARGMFWYQGESDGANATGYLPNFTELHADWLADFPALERIYVVQVRPGCGSPSLELRDLQRRLADLLPRVVPCTANAIPNHDSCHYLYNGYRVLGDRMAMLVGRDYYAAPLPSDVESPNILSAHWTSAAHDEFTLTFRQTGDTIIAEAGCEADLKLGTGDVVIALTPSGNTLTVTLAAPSTMTEVGYGSHSGTVSRGWIVNASGVGAMSFEEIPLQ